MIKTKETIKINKNNWVKVLDGLGFVTVNISCYYAYSDTQPQENIKGNYTNDKQINSVSNAKMWIKKNRYIVLAVPNEEVE